MRPFRQACHGIAYHEAAHAIVKIELAGPESLNEVCIFYRPDSLFDAFQWHFWPKRDEGVVRQNKEVARERGNDAEFVMAAIASLLAPSVEFEMNGNAKPCSEQDITDAHELAGLTAPTPQLLDQGMRAALVVARKVLSEREDALHGMAAQLLASGRITDLTPYRR